MTQLSPKFKRRFIQVAVLSMLVAAYLYFPASDTKPVPDVGLHRVQFQTSANTNSAAVIGIPDASEKTVKPVLLFLNGKGENGDDGLFQLSNNFGQDLWRRRGAVPFLVVCPQCSVGGLWTAESPDGKAAMAILDQAIERFGGDPDRVFVTGPSSGGAGAIAMASAFPERFAGVIGVSTTFVGDADQLSDAGVPIWVFYNSGDSPTICVRAGNTKLEWLKAGLSPLVSELPGKDHNAWDPAYAPPAIYSWMLRQTEPSKRIKEPFRLCTATDVLKGCSDIQHWKIEDEFTLRWDEIQDVRQTTGALNPKLSLPAHGASQTHFELWLENKSAVTFNLILDEAVNSASKCDFRMLLELPDCGTGVGIRTEAQRTLFSGWNDVRLHRNEGRIQVFLNGWLAADIVDLSGIENAAWRLSGDTSIVLRIRYVRDRIVAQDSSAHPLTEDHVVEPEVSRIERHTTEDQNAREYAWTVVRDSRLSNAGNSPASSGLRGKCKILERQVAIEMPCRVLNDKSLGEVLYNDDPALARTEFRAFLLDDRLRGEQTPPTWKTKRINTVRGVRPTVRGVSGGLDEALLLAPLLAFDAENVLNISATKLADRIARSDGKHLSVWATPADSALKSEEIWRDESDSNRVIRWIERCPKGVSRQIDFQWTGTGDDRRLEGWTCLLMHPSGQVLDFQTVAVSSEEAFFHE